MFTDFSFDNLGVPRNANIPPNNAGGAPAYTPVNSDDGVQSYYDLGICGPLRDNGGQNLFGVCGQFKVPTLRNIAVTAPYFHNGQFATLEHAIGFYVRRDTNPEQFYPPPRTAASPSSTTCRTVRRPIRRQHHRTGQRRRLRRQRQHQRDSLQPPLRAARRPVPGEINDVITFLCTLTDGYDPTNPTARTARAMPGRCGASQFATRTT